MDRPTAGHAPARNAPTEASVKGWRYINFDQPGDFVACRAAEAWLYRNGYSVGSMQGHSPRGIMRGDWLVAKWRNLSQREREELVGTMNGDMRHGPVSIQLREHA